MPTQLWVFCAEYWAVVAITLKAQHTVLLYGPKLEYASCVWNPYLQQNINKIESVQRRAARYVFNDYSRYSHVNQWYKVLDGTHSITEDFFHKAPSFIKFIWAMVTYHFHLMSYRMKDHQELELQTAVLSNKWKWITIFRNILFIRGQ